MHIDLPAQKSVGHRFRIQGIEGTERRGRTEEVRKEGKKERRKEGGRRVARRRIRKSEKEGNYIVRRKGGSKEGREEGLGSMQEFL